MRRRQFLTLAASSAALLGPTRLWAAGPSHPRLLVVFLRGGYDCANLLVPISSHYYYETRPNIAIARPDPSNPGVNPAAALAIDSDWGLHPALRDSIWPLVGSGQIAFVPFA